MTIYGTTFDNQNNSAKDDGGLYQSIVSDGVLWGCATTLLQNKITIQAGQIIIGGRIITITGSEVIDLVPTENNGFGQVLLTIDLDGIATETVFEQLNIVQRYATSNSFPSLVQESINTTGTIYQWELARVEVNSSAVTSIINEPVESTISMNSYNALRLGGYKPNYYATGASVTAVQNNLDAAISNFNTAIATTTNKINWWYASSQPSFQPGFTGDIRFMSRGIGEYWLKATINTPAGTGAYTWAMTLPTASRPAVGQDWPREPAFTSNGEYASIYRKSDGAMMIYLPNGATRVYVDIAWTVNLT